MNRAERRRAEKNAAMQRRKMGYASFAAPPDQAVTSAIQAAISQLGQGNIAGALTQAQKAVDGGPANPDAQAILGTVLEASGNSTGAILHLEKAVELAKHHYRAWINLGKSRLNINENAEAAKAFQSALSIKPDEPEALYLLGRAHVRHSNYAAAIVPLQKALTLTPRDPEVQFGVALAQEGLRLYDEALAGYRRTLELAPDHVENLVELGQLLQSIGEFDEAEIHMRRALKLDASQTDVYFKLAAMNRLSDSDLEALNDLLASKQLEPVNEADLRFTLGSEADKAGKYDEAFSHFSAANALRKQAASFEQATIKELFNSIKTSISADTIANLDGANPSTQPVFVFGMPRSGSTLVEQMIAAHPKAAGAGEISSINALVQRQIEQGPGRFIDMLAGLSARGAKSLAKDYLANLPAFARDADRVVDKSLENGVWLGLVYRLFPNAKYIWCRRDRLDTCLSAYFSNMQEGLSYTNDLADLGFYHREHDHLIGHWQKILPIDIHEASYEAIINDPEKEARALIDHIGLEWDSACLNYHKADTVVLTASVHQVRQPVYKTSSGRWKNYEAHIGPLKAALAAES